MKDNTPTVYVTSQGIYFKRKVKRFLFSNIEMAENSQPYIFFDWKSILKIDIVLGEQINFHIKPKYTYVLDSLVDFRIEEVVEGYFKKIIYGDKHYRVIFFGATWVNNKPNEKWQSIGSKYPVELVYS